MRAFRALFSLLAPLVLLAASSSEASAYERQWQAGLSAGYTHFVNGGGNFSVPGSLPGFGTSLSLSYGLNDSLNIIGHADMSVHPGAAPVLIGGGGVGMAYVLDVLRWVPWIGLTAGGYAVSVREPCITTEAAPCTTGHFGLSPQGGVDYQVNRKFSIGAGVRWNLLFFGNPNALDQVDQAISGFVRAQYIWGY
jgi:hypothetical protein